jgi:hypothetical protein
MDPLRWVRKHSDSNDNSGGGRVSLQTLSLSIAYLPRQMGNVSAMKAKGRGVQEKGKTIRLKRGEDAAIRDSNHPR